MANPEPHDSKKLKGYPYRRADIGEYRIVYRVEGDVLKITVAGKRNDSESTPGFGKISSVENVPKRISEPRFWQIKTGV